MANIQTRIDELYQRPPGEFIAARNALAKEAGAHGAEIKRLAKPSVPAWAVNQLYWKRREDYDALVKAATDLRRIHKSIIGGHRGDIREATRAHDAAVDRALKATLALLRDEGQPVTDATRHAIQTTLRALPAGDAPGRLTQPLQPGGFEMLTGLSVVPARPGPDRAKPEPAPAAKAKAGAAARGKSRDDAKARQQAQQAKEAAAKAARDLREAQHAAQRAEFELARTTREAEKAAAAVERAREAVETAQKELEEAEPRAREAARACDGARRRAESAAAAVERLRNR